MAVQGFWGLTMENEEKTFTQEVKFPFRLSMASLSHELKDKKERTSLNLTVDDKTFTLCSLIPEKTDQVLLDIEFVVGELVTFSKIGANTIHLTGNYILDDDLDLDEEDDEAMEALDENDLLEALVKGNVDDDESDSLEDSEEDLEDDSGEEEEAQVEIKKRPAESSNEKTNSKKQKADTAKKPKIDEKKEKVTKEKKQAEDKKQAELKKQAEQKKQAELKKLAELKKQAELQKLAEQKQAEQKKLAEQKKQAEEKKQEDKKKQDETKKKQGQITTLPNGLIIEDIKVGTGPAAKKGSKVGMRYIGRLMKNGKVFDKNQSGKPFQFKLGAGVVIRGWDIGVAGMKVGGERKLTIPAPLAYGKEAIPSIPPNSTLIFEIKLVTMK